MERSLDFIKDIANWAKKVSKYPDAKKVISSYNRGMITLHEAYNELCQIEARAISLQVKEEINGKLRWKDLNVGDNFLWVTDDRLDGYNESLCKVEEVYDDHLIARELKYDYTVWIENDNEVKAVS